MSYEPTTLESRLTLVGCSGPPVSGAIGTRIPYGRVDNYIQEGGGLVMAPAEMQCPIVFQVHSDRYADTPYYKRNFERIVKAGRLTKLPEEHPTGQQFTIPYPFKDDYYGFYQKGGIREKVLALPRYVVGCVEEKALTYLSDAGMKGILNFSIQQNKKGKVIQYAGRVEKGTAAKVRTIRLNRLNVRKEEGNEVFYWIGEDRTADKQMVNAWLSGLCAYFDSLWRRYDITSLCKDSTEQSKLLKGHLKLLEDLAWTAWDGAMSTSHDLILPTYLRIFCLFSFKAPSDELQRKFESAAYGIGYVRENELMEWSHFKAQLDELLERLGQPLARP